MKKNAVNNVNVISLAKSVNAFYQHAPRQWGNEAKAFVEPFRNIAMACAKAAKAKDEVWCKMLLTAFYKKAFCKLHNTTKVEMYQGADDGRRLGFIEIMHRIKMLNAQA